MNKHQRQNLLKLATFLFNYKPVGQTSFGMSNYSSIPGYLNLYPGELKTHINTCGTVACAAGHGPLIGIKPKPEEIWPDYVERVFGVRHFVPAWSWMFSGEWARRDNTPRGAAKRILYFLEHGVPENSLDQRMGWSPRCYTRMKL